MDFKHNGCKNIPNADIVLKYNHHYNSFKKPQKSKFGRTELEAIKHIHSLSVRFVNLTIGRKPFQLSTAIFMLLLLWKYMQMETWYRKQKIMKWNHKDRFDSNTVYVLSYSHD